MLLYAIPLQIIVSVNFKVAAKMWNIHHDCKRISELAISKKVRVALIFRINLHINE